MNESNVSRFIALALTLDVEKMLQESQYVHSTSFFLSSISRTPPRTTRVGRPLVPPGCKKATALVPLYTGS